MEDVVQVWTMYEIYADDEQRHYEDDATGTVLVFERPDCDGWPPNIVVTVVGER